MNDEIPRFTPLARKRGKLRFVIGFIVVASILASAFIYFQAQSLVSQFSAGEKQEIVDSTEPELGIPARKPQPGLREAQTYLLIGADARPGETSSRSDTTMLVRLYPKEKIASVLSIPRDLWVEIPGYGSDRINAAYAYGGLPLLTATLREWLGVPIDHFFAVDFSSFAQVVDDLGGVYLPIDQTYFHVNDGQAENDWAAIDVKHGYQRLDGEDALAWVRFRHLDSDFHRASRQQIFLREAGRQLRQSGLGSFPKLAKTISKGTTSDIKLNELLSMANTLRQIPAENIVRVTMPGAGTTINGASVLLISEEEKDQVVEIWDNPERLLAGQKKRPSASKKEQLQQDFVSLLVSTVIELDPDNQAAARRWLARQQEQAGLKRARRPQGRVVADLSRSPAPSINSGKVPYCRPTRLPDGYYWPDDAWRSYELAGKASGALYATKSSGVSLLWSFTAWRQAPILEAPNDAVELSGQRFQLYWEGETLRLVSWEVAGGVAWVQNTLQNELNKEEMLGLATSCSQKAKQG